MLNYFSQIISVILKWGAHFRFRLLGSWVSMSKQWDTVLLHGFPGMLINNQEASLTTIQNPATDENKANIRGRDPELEMFPHCQIYRLTRQEAKWQIINERNYWGRAREWKSDDWEPGVLASVILSLYSCETVPLFMFKYMLSQVRNSLLFFMSCAKKEASLQQVSETKIGLQHSLCWYYIAGS